MGPDLIRTGAISDDFICTINYVQFPYIHKQEQFVFTSYPFYAARCSSTSYMPKYGISFILAIVCYILSTYG